MKNIKFDHSQRTVAKSLGLEKPHDALINILKVLQEEMEKRTNLGTHGPEGYSKSEYLEIVAQQADPRDILFLASDFIVRAIDEFTKENCECPACTLRRKLESAADESSLSNLNIEELLKKMGRNN